MLAGILDLPNCDLVEDFVSFRYTAFSLCQCGCGGCTSHSGRRRVSVFAGWGAFPGNAYAGLVAVAVVVSVTLVLSL